MSYWAAVVAAGFVEAVPVVGKLLKLVVMGGYAVGGATLRRFFVFHCVLPFVVIAMACLHVVLVHRRGQLSPIANRLPTRMAFSNVWPALASKDALAVALYLLALAGLCLLAPDLLANSANYAPADYLVTPKNVKPEWYFWPFFAVLKAFESKLAGFVVALALNASLFVLPYAHADLRGVASVRVYRRAAVTFAASFGALAVLGGRQPSSLSSFMSKVCVAWYVGFVAWPLMTRCVRRLVIELEAGALT